MAKVRTNVKPIHRKPTVHVPLTGGYTPAEEKAMQERKVALIEKQEKLLETIAVNTNQSEQRLAQLVLAITALSNVLQVLVTQAVPAKRTRKPYEKAQEGTQEPAGTPPAVEPSPAIDTTVTHSHSLAAAVTHSLAAAQEFAAKQVKPPAPEGLVHESITSEQKALAQAKAPPTLDELRTTFLDFIAKNGREEGIGKLKSFGIAKLGELPVNEYAAFKSTLA